MEENTNKKKSNLKKTFDFLLKIFAWVPLTTLAAMGTTYISIHDMFKTDYSYEIMKVVAQIKQESTCLSIIDMPEQMKQDPIVKKARSLQNKIQSAMILLSSINVNPNKSNNIEIDGAHYINEIKKIKRFNDENKEINIELENLILSYPESSRFFNLKEYKRISTESYGILLDIIDEAQSTSNNPSHENAIKIMEKILHDKRLLTCVESKSDEFFFVFGFLNTIQINVKQKKR